MLWDGGLTLKYSTSNDRAAFKSSTRLSPRRSLMTGFHQKSHEATSGPYGGSGKVLIQCVSKYSFTTADL